MSGLKRDGAGWLRNLECPQLSNLEALPFFFYKSIHREATFKEFMEQ
jgi:hypothetical protein